MRFLNKVTGHTDKGDHVVIDVETPDGTYQLEADYYIAAEGAASPTRKRMNLPFEGQTFEEHFLIVDVEMQKSPFESGSPERWFWFAPPFHHGQSALLHKQPDNIYRIDLQLGPDTDPKAEAAEEKVIPRIKAIVGDTPFRLDCIQDVDNLGWKLAAVLSGDAPVTLLDSYNEERSHGSAENILNSSRATNFMTPKSPIEALFRNAVLDLAETHPFARKLINSGRLSQPCSLHGKTLQSGDHPLVGQSLIDAPVGNGWLVEQAQGAFTLLSIGDDAAPDGEGIRTLHIAAPSPELSRRYGAGHYLIRPDGHICACFGSADRDQITAALARAKGQSR
mgnify:CR=1 FL=1